MTRVQLQNIGQAFTGAPLLKDISVAIESGQYVVFLGPSGCGKTTLLRIIAGLQDPDCGDVIFDGSSVKALEPRKRDVALVFQQDGLYPHLTVGQTIELGLDRNLSADQRRAQFDDAVRLTRIAPIVDRYPENLSGGEMRRAAIAKAIARRASVRLLDEPLSALDGPVRQALQDVLAQWHRESPGTTIHVTHDGQEAMRMADKIAVIEEGSIIQFASPEQIYSEPASVTVAHSIGSSAMNLISGSINRGQVDSDEPALSVQLSVDSKVPDQPVWIGIRPDAFVHQSSGFPVSFSGRVQRVCRVEREFELALAGEAANVHATTGNLDSQVGDAVCLSVPATEVHLFATSSGRRIELS